MFNLNSLLRKNILTLEPYSSARDEFMGEASVFLDANESPYDNGLNRYPDPYQRILKKAITAKRGIDPAKIMLGNGSDEVIDLLIRAFCEPGIDNLITLPPTYGMYKVSANINNIVNREILLNTDFQPNTERILSSVDENTKLIFVCSPNNPTGNLVAKNHIIRLLENFKGLVVVDEAYIDFAPEGSVIDLLNRYPNLVVMQTFSKAMALAGIRLGICFASEEIISVLNKIKPPYNVNQLTQVKALLALEKTKEVQLHIDELIKEKENLISQLQFFHFVERIFPSDANFLLVKTIDPKDIYNYLLANGIVVRNRSNVPLCEGCLRITIGTPAENKILVSVLKNYITN